MRGLAVDEEIRHGAHAVFVGGGGLDEVAEHVVVLDLQALDAGRLDVLGLHPGDDAAAFVAEGAGVVEFGVVAGGDIAAVAGEEGRFGDEGAGEVGDELVVAEEGLGGLMQQGRGVGKELGDAARLLQPRTDRGDVGDAAQGFAELVAEGGGVEEVVERGLAGVDGVEVKGRRGNPAFEEARAAGGDGAVDGGEEGAFAAAGEGLRQFQVAARRSGIRPRWVRWK